MSNSSQIENQVYPLKGPKQYVRQFSDRSYSLFSRRPIAILQTISTQKQVYPLEDPQIEASYFSQRPKSIFQKHIEASFFFPKPTILSS